MRPCDVPGFEALSVNCSKDSYPANKKVIILLNMYLWTLLEWKPLDG